MSDLAQIIAALNSITPIGLLAGVSYIIYMFVAKNGPVKKVTNNHLHHMEKSLEKIADASERQEDLLREIVNGVNYLRGRAD